MVDGILYCWFALTVLSLIYATYDLLWVTPEAAVMKWGWWLVILYSGPIGLFYYLLSCKEPMPGTHEAFIAPHWKQALGSTVHCLAGDVTGIILAALVLAFFSVSLPMEITIEYLAGFGFGLLIFQSLFMKNRMGGSYEHAVKISFYPEFTSMNMIMAGMIPVMVIWMLIEPSASSPASLHFWGKMSLATIIAGHTAYPINSWLVKKKLKHGMMTVGKKMASDAQEMPHEHMQAHSPQVTPRQKWSTLILTLIGLGIGILISMGAWIIK